MQDKLTFIGAGNMASSIIGGLINKGYDAASITATDAQQSQLDRVSETFSVISCTNNKQAVQNATIVVLAVKPNVMQSVCREIGAALTHSVLIISIAAGVRSADIQRWLGQDQAVVRCMPNTPALLGLGANALFANAQCSKTQRNQAEQLLAATGITQWIDNEAHIDIVTALSGSGPAYFFYLIECMTNAATDMGLSEDVAQTLAIETAYGAATMARERLSAPAQLRENVTSKGGTTAAALASFADADFGATVAKAMTAARDRAHALAEELSQPPA